MVTKSNKKGFVLVAVLWVVVVLMVIVAAVGRSSRLDMKICRLTRTEELRCKWASRAGIETAIAVLNEDPRASDGLADLWSENEEDFNDIELKQCCFTVRVIDEASKLNVNTATKKQLLELPDMTEEIADAIIDWRDKNDIPRQGGAEGGYYENLRYGYSIRNGPFRTIDDELDKGWIAYLTCYSYDRNKDAAGNERVNINKADEKKLEKSLKIKKPYAKWIVENRKKNKYKSIADLIKKNSAKKAKKSSKKDSDKAEPLDLETFYKIADQITVSGKKKLPGKVNINTAPKVVLTALLGGGDAAEKLADEIIAYREGLMFGMRSIADMMKAGSMKIDTFKKIANHITTRSDVYTVRCFATADRNGVSGATLQTESVVDRSSTPCRVLYWYQGASN
jgi:DNA uptake protein ComE-like DNA-binding protein